MGSATDLVILIQSLRQLNEGNSPLLSKVKHPDLLISSLNELNNLVGILGIKKSIVSQVQYLIVSQYNHLSQQNSTFSYPKFEDHVLHTVIYGPPGVGKTKVGVILAKIWTAMGLLKPQSKPSSGSRSPVESSLRDRLADLLCVARVVTLRSKIQTQREHLRRVTDIVQEKKEILSHLRHNIIQIRPPLIAEREGINGETSSQYESKWDDLLQDTRDLRLSLDEILHETHLDGSTSSLDESIAASSSEGMSPHSMTEGSDISTGPTITIKIASRADFIADYQGQTPGKTLRLLNDNLGGVLFIDEAYNLLTGDSDSYGQEALTTLNQFMSEHPNEIVVIFAGYKDLLQRTIFTAQPGLKRRCAWVFEIDGYDADSLNRIFIRQLEQYNWSLDPSIKLTSFFSVHKSSFPSYGGDTQRLSFYCKLAYSQDKFRQIIENISSSSSIVLDNVITSSMLETALQELVQNNAKDNSIPKEIRDRLYS